MSGAPPDAAGSCATDAVCSCTLASLMDASLAVPDRSANAGVCGLCAARGSPDGRFGHCRRGGCCGRRRRSAAGGSCSLPGHRQRLATVAQLRMVLAQALRELPAGVRGARAELLDVGLAFAAGRTEVGEPRPAHVGQLAFLFRETFVEASLALR